MRYLFFLFYFAVAGCAATVRIQPPISIYRPEPPPVHVYEEPPSRPVVSVYIEPPIEQPEPIIVRWAPPPMLVATPPPLPHPGAVWVGGYWVWNGDWVWAYGRWVDPPRHGYHWEHPYYENRNSQVVFITGHWSPEGAVFVPPPININITISEARPGIFPGSAPIGPSGVFIPAPPGSRRGIIVPAPIGTPPAVVTGAPPVIKPGMHISRNTTNINSNNTYITNNVTNITNVTIIAPASSTASGKAVNVSVPAQAHMAASQKPIVRVDAPHPVSTTPISAFVPGKAMPHMPPPQAVKPVVPPELQQKRLDRDKEQQRKQDDSQVKKQDPKRDMDQQHKDQELRKYQDSIQREKDPAHQMGKDNQGKAQDIKTKEQQIQQKNIAAPKPVDAYKADKDAKQKQQDQKKKDQALKQKNAKDKPNEMDINKKEQDKKSKDVE
jgi:hypothetical protein